MARDRLTFRQRDLKAALAACKAAGVSVAGVDVKHDGFRIIAGEPTGQGIEADVEKIAMERLHHVSTSTPRRRRKVSPPQ